MVFHKAENFSMALREQALGLVKNLIAPSADGCHLWQGKKHNGYGRLFFGGKTIAAHRLSYMLFVGDIPAGLMICHKCNVPDCVNPDHLYAGTAKDNAQDMLRSGRCANQNTERTSCLKGHEYTEENTIWRIGRPRTNRYRVCAECDSIRRADQSEKRRIRNGGVGPTAPICGYCKRYVGKREFESGTAFTRHVPTQTKWSEPLVLHYHVKCAKKRGTNADVLAALAEVAG